MNNIFYYSPFEPTKVTFFEFFENFIVYTQYYTSNIICLISMTILLITYVFFFNVHYMNSIIFYYLSLVYDFIYDVAYDYLNKQINYYFSFLLYIFLFILFSNLIGMLPFAFSITSHLTSTLACALFIWLTVITLGFSKNKLVFFKIILPKGIPYVLVPFLIFVEFLSYTFRVVSLSLRLFANVLAGHILLHVVSGFIFFILTSSISGFMLITAILGFLLLGLLCILFFFELVVAILQSYIFIVLSLIYLQDVNNVSH